MARDAYERHKQQIDALIQSPDAARWWEQYPDEHAGALWAGMYWLSRDPDTPPAVAKRAETLWEAFLRREG
jgi:hypothetical protein